MSYFPYFFGEQQCPPVFRVLADGGLKRWTEQRTLCRQPGEDEHAFAQRAQATAFQLFLQGGYKRGVRIECIYKVPADPNFFDDDRANARRSLLHVMQDRESPGEVRLAAVKAFSRLTGLVSPDEPW